jgi:hypothetical protein
VPQTNPALTESQAMSGKLAMKIILIIAKLPLALQNIFPTFATAFFRECRQKSPQ